MTRPKFLGQDAAQRYAKTLGLPLPKAEVISYRAAMARAPWGKARRQQMPTPELEREYREAFADALVDYGAARESGAPSPSGGHRHPNRSIRVAEEEWARWQRLARVAGMSVTQWVLERLAVVEC